jgi:hypothetical protein
MGAKLSAMTDEARRARAEARRDRVVIQRVSLGADVTALEGTPSERVATAVALTRAAWAMSGRPWPEPGAARTTVRFVPRGAK